MRTYYELTRRLGLPPRRIAVVAVVILAALAAGGGGGSVAVAAGGKYDDAAAAAGSRPWGSYSYGAAAAAGSRPWGSYSYGAGAAAVATLAVEDVLAPEFFPVGLVGGRQKDVGYGAVENPNKQYCSTKCADPGQSYTGRDCIYKEHCSH
ncbi:hypothetical protein GUJ93_ZPchr0012g20012 [Zizania palustris]|uniref:Uncharacterized protein n=1 Tax=Zizania palustris TaxID=103762 RepID=A0A8J5WQ55_ZIZPA|nr:hypothetical protein GUJ93_ZPchr0012g20012 [Zizania palustris]